MEKLIENLLEKILEKESKPELFSIIQKLDTLNFNSKEDVREYIETHINLEED